MSATPGCALAVLTADCAPVALASPEGVFGVAHAGWRGLVAGVLERTVDAMRALGATEIGAVLGPCIRAECYEFGPADLDRVAARLGDGVRATTAVGRARPRPARRRCGPPSAAAGVDRRRRRRRLHRLLARPLLLAGPGRAAAPGDGGVAMTPRRAVTIDPADVAVRLSAVRRRIAAAGGDDRRIRIVAVTKGFGPDAVRAAVAAGLADVGENYAEELAGQGAPTPSAATTAGGVAAGTSSAGSSATRCKRLAAARAPVAGASTGPPPGEEIARRAPGARVLVQVNVSGEPQKNGCALADAPRARRRAAVPRPRRRRPDGGRARRARRTAPGPASGSWPRMADRLGLPERSMGMTDDLEVAVEEGSTMVRVGRALFGPRSVPTDLRR